MRIILFLLLFASQFFAQTKPEDVKSFTLKNGMKFFVLEKNSIPNANMYLFFKVGSRNENIGITGISHFFEHMMFNGAKKYGPKEFDRVMEANGGSNNAYTTENVTVYTDWFPKQSLEIIFDLESDRVANLNFDPKMIESERGVILSERSTGLENNPLEQLWQELQATAFVAHPYMWPVIGWESDIKNWTKEDLENYFHTYYAPNNCLVVISGDVKMDQVKSLAEKYFGHIPAGPKPREIHTVEPEQTGERRLFVKRQVPTPYLMIAYHVPQTGSEDYYALELLNSILSEGPSSRLYQSIVEQQQLAVEVGTYYPNAFDPTLFYFYGICNEDVTASKLENAILYELDRIINEGVSEAELQKVKNQKLMEFYRTTETINGMSNTIGTYELFFGDYRKLFSAPDDYKKVTTDDIKRVAAKYFTKQNRTVGILNTEEE
ncbi:MAG: insulinase family protein [Ignavibacterium album]|uniref:M16 family metallopeptidase n=1 Tax=Ignavibacterium album TaxID=591197 RepID=UPI0026EB4A0D|nr:pitrilysin family protein [Ignavibacterium album]MCX8104387.1 insulinase family protein [Ignavibacterium album]